MRTDPAKLRALHALGHNDARISTAIGVSRQRVRKMRMVLGLSAVLDHFVPTPAQIAILRIASDRAMERETGVGSSVWRKARARHGIPRFRAPTTGLDHVPQPKAPKAPSVTRPVSASDWISRMTPEPRIPMRDTSPEGEAASFLRAKRWVVFDRRKVYGERDALYQVGNMRLAPVELIAMAVRHGFEAREFA